MTGTQAAARALVSRSVSHLLTAAFGFAALTAKSATKSLLSATAAGQGVFDTILSQVVAFLASSAAFAGSASKTISHTASGVTAVGAGFVARTSSRVLGASMTCSALVARAVTSVKTATLAQAGSVARSIAHFVANAAFTCSAIVGRGRDLLLSAVMAAGSATFSANRLVNSILLALTAVTQAAMGSVSRTSVKSTSASTKAGLGSLAKSTAYLLTSLLGFSAVTTDTILVTLAGLQRGFSATASRTTNRLFGALSVAPSSSTVRAISSTLSGALYFVGTTARSAAIFLLGATERFAGTSLPSRTREFLASTIAASATLTRASVHAIEAETARQFAFVGRGLFTALQGAFDFLADLVTHLFNRPIPGRVHTQEFCGRIVLSSTTLGSVVLFDRSAGILLATRPTPSESQ
jgi:hypothetical protein